MGAVDDEFERRQCPLLPHVDKGSGVFYLRPLRKGPYMKLDGRVALITGAGSGLGREIALTFAREGARVAINDLRKEAAEQTAEEIRALGGEPMVLVADVSDSVEVRAMFGDLISQWHTLDLLVNNAGMVLVTDEVKARLNQAAAEAVSGTAATVIGAASNMTDSQWRRTLSVHLDGTFYCTREALAVMEAKRSGKIINIASVAGISGLMGSPDYSAAKAGIIGFTKAVAREAIRCGVYVNAIAPGFIDTPLLNVMDGSARQLTLLQIPIGRLGTAAEVAALALYLAGDDSSYVVGQVISPNGGYAI
jgi:3-oxoacyl-[acyl-carrier protein] reductase